MSKDSTLYFVKKGNKFMKGHGYSTMMGYRFTWTSKQEEARTMEWDIAYQLSAHSKGKVTQATNY